MSIGPRSVRSWIPLALGLGAVGLAVVVLVRDQAALRSLTGIGMSALVVIGALQLVNAGTDAIRYRMPWPRRFRAAIGGWEWIEVFMTGRLMNMVVPQAGTVFRSMRLRAAHEFPVSSYLGSVFLITWMGNAVAVALAAILVFGSGRWQPGVMMLVVALAIVGVIVAVGRAPKLASSVFDRLPARFGGLLERLAESFIELSGDRRRTVRVLAVSLLTQLAGLVAYVLTVQALGVSEPWVVGAVLYAGTTVATVVSLSPGGLGITELAAAGAGVLVDAGAGTGVAAALVIRATGTIAVVTLAGGAWVARFFGRHS